MDLICYFMQNLLFSSVFTECLPYKIVLYQSVSIKLKRLLQEPDDWALKRNHNISSGEEKGMNSSKQFIKTGAEGDE